MTGGPAKNIQWSSSPSGLNVDPSSGLIDLASSTSGTYSVYYNFTGENGCSVYPVPASTVTINPQATIDNQPSNDTLCPEIATATFFVNSTSNPSPTYTWWVLPPGGSWSQISASDTNYAGQGTSTLTVKNLMSGDTKDGYEYRTDLTVNSICPVTSNAGRLAIRSIWHGYTNTDWNTSTNWSDNAVPSQQSCDSVIILNTNNQPIIAPNAMGSVNHLKMRPRATLWVKGRLQIAGSITDDNKAIEATAGTIELNGDKELYSPYSPRDMQTIAAHMFYTPYTNNYSGRLLNLEINSPNNATVAQLELLRIH